MGETRLASLIASMQPELNDGVFVFATLRQGDRLPAGLVPIMTFRESEGLTLIVRQDEAEAAGLAGAFRCRWITLTVHSSLEAVGFLAAITACLADAGISCNTVSAFHHDHLFVPENRSGEVIELLTALGSKLR